MRRRSTIKAVCSMCYAVLNGKRLCDYSDNDRKLRIQGSTLQKVWKDYEDYKIHQTTVLKWCVDFDGCGADYKIIADAWRWAMGVNKKLPVKIQRYR